MGSPGEAVGSYLQTKHLHATTECTAAPQHLASAPHTAHLAGLMQAPAEPQPQCQISMNLNARQACIGIKKEKKIKISHESQQPSAGIALPGV